LHPFAIDRRVTVVCKSVLQPTENIAHCGNGESGVFCPDSCFSVNRLAKRTIRPATIKEVVPMKLSLIVAQGVHTGFGKTSPLTHPKHI
jgi:hypothetical protein